MVLRAGSIGNYYCKLLLILQILSLTQKLNVLSNCNVMFCISREREMVPERVVADGGSGHPPGRECGQAAVRAGAHAHYAHRYVLVDGHRYCSLLKLKSQVLIIRHVSIIINVSNLIYRLRRGRPFENGLRKRHGRRGG